MKRYKLINTKTLTLLVPVEEDLYFSNAIQTDWWDFQVPILMTFYVPVNTNSLKTPMQHFIQRSTKHTVVVHWLSHLRQKSISTLVPWKSYWTTIPSRWISHLWRYAIYAWLTLREMQHSPVHLCCRCNTSQAFKWAMNLDSCKRENSVSPWKDSSTIGLYFPKVDLNSLYLLVHSGVSMNYTPNRRVQLFLSRVMDNSATVVFWKIAMTLHDVLFTPVSLVKQFYLLMLLTTSFCFKMIFESSLVGRYQPWRWRIWSYYQMILQEIVPESGRAWWCTLQLFEKHTNPSHLKLFS